MGEPRKMQNNFDKLNEIFGVKPEGGEETAAKEEAREPETAPEQAAAPEPAGEETKVIKPLSDSQPVPEKPAEEAPQEETPAPGDEGGEPEEKSAPHFKGPLKFIDSFIYDPKKHEKDAEEAAKQPHEPPEDEPEELDDEDEPIEPRDYQPIRGRRDGKTGCLGGLMYFAFVVSLSIILACVVWMAASDVLALNKPLEDGTVTLPQSIFTEKVIEVENEDGTTTTKTVMSADIDYVATALKDAGLIEYKPLFKLFCKVVDADIKIDPGTYKLNTKCDYNALVISFPYS